MYASNPEVQWFFLRLMSLIYLLVYASLIKEIRGLFGPRGIHPIGLSNTVLMFLIYLGVSCSLASFIGYYPALFIFICWSIYYYLRTKDGCRFFNKHWDAFLIEVGFFTIFYSLQSPAPFYLALALPIFLFRFFLSAGLHKFFNLANTGQWLNLTALSYFYETQPVPNRLAYYFHQFPSWVSKISTFCAIVPFFLVPLLIFTPYSYIAFILIFIQQTLIFITGNFPWFNPLVIIASLPLLNIHNTLIPGGITFSTNTVLTAFLNIVGFLLIFLNTRKFLLDFFLWFFPKLVYKNKKIFNSLFNYPSQFNRIVQGYNVYCWVPTVRKEMIIEGSRDGKKWKPYILRGVLADTKQPPPQIAPIYRRLYWVSRGNTSFGSPLYCSWFIPFLGCLLEGVPEVLDLLVHNPFPNNPPTYVRVLYYQYRFTTLERKRKTGKWWERKYLGFFSPPYKLQTYRDPQRKYLNRRPILANLK